MFCSSRSVSCQKFQHFGGRDFKPKASLVIEPQSYALFLAERHSMQDTEVTKQPDYS